MPTVICNREFWVVTALWDRMCREPTAAWAVIYARVMVDPRGQALGRKVPTAMWASE
jgi:hypothetical protein